MTKDNEMPNDNDVVGNVQVRVSRSQVYRSCQNIINNELKLKAADIKSEVLAKAAEQVEKLVMEYLRGNTYDQANLRSRVDTALRNQERNLNELVRGIIKEEVIKHIQNQIHETIEVVLKNTEFRVGWGSNATKVTVKLKE